MKNKRKTKKQLVGELVELRQQITKLKVLEVKRKKVGEEETQQSLKKVQRNMEGTIRAMASTVKTRDPYTAGHQRKVTQLAKAIAKEMGLTKDAIDSIETAATIHDIGKLGIPAEVLSKPDRLTKTEFNLIKAHPQVGYDILREIEFPWPIAQIVLEHHERLDGSGYPQGLSSKDIILQARILAVADVVEGMSSHRPYRPALGIDKALEEISKNKKSLYDPEVVDACLRLFKKKGFKLE